MEIGAIITAVLSGAVAWALVRQADKNLEEERQAELMRMGGWQVSDTPWPTIETAYSAEQIDQMQQYPSLSLPTPPPVSVPVSPPSPSPSPHTQESLIEPAVQPVHEPVREPVQPITGSDWLTMNRPHLPIEMPPENVSCYADRVKRLDAKDMVLSALEVGLSKNAIALEVFGIKKGGSKAYKQISSFIDAIAQERLSDG